MKFREIIVKSINLEESNYINSQDEIKTFEPLNIYLVPKKGGSHERFVTDSEGIISKQSIESNDTFDIIANRGNSTTKNEIILASAKGRAATLGFNETTYGYYFGDMNPAHTGSHNVAMGFNTLNKLTTGAYNTAIGNYSLSAVTEGGYNTTLGYATGYQLNRSSSNVFVGQYAGFNLKTEISETDLANTSPAAAEYMKELSSLSGYNGTSFNTSLNTFVGACINSYPNSPTRSAMSTIIGASTLSNMLYRNFNNIVIGAGNHLRSANSSMNNSIIIGNCINLPNQIDSLAIGLNKSRRIYASEAIIYGELPNNKLLINAPLTIPSQYMPNAQGSTEFTKNIVAKPDGTFGWEDKNNDDLRRLSYMSELTYTQDDNNYYIKGTAYLCMKDGVGGNAGIGSNLKVFVDNKQISDISADRDSWYLSNFSYTTGEGTANVSQMILPFTITISKSMHPESFWTSGYFYATVVSTHNPFDYNKPTIIQKGVRLKF
ncbi:hypothetical protein GCM10023210_21940 [Chryseobacterium ginsengisoli]|uniref:Trimeric autotransporter adhesin YadA-like head domain-containing protein n=1 Tax=Chryseobacterium ginsengisoli TaxID=363853 RepID=A0ABP9MCT8_9FLAO